MADVTYTPIRTRILRAVIALGKPTTLEVAERAMTPTAETLNHLNALASQGEVERRGRRWAARTTEMLTSPAVPVSDEDSFLDDEQQDSPGCWLTVVVMALALGLWMGSCVSLPW